MHSNPKSPFGFVTGSDYGVNPFVDSFCRCIGATQRRVNNIETTPVHSIKLVTSRQLVAAVCSDSVNERREINCRRVPDE